MQLADFKLLVADYLNRAGAAFDVDTPGKVDKILVAANNAKLYAQKLIRFEAAKTWAKVTVTQTGGGLLSSAVAFADGTTPVSVRSIQRAYLQNRAGVWFPIGVVQAGPKVEAFRKGGEYSDQQVIYTGSTVDLVKDGDELYISPWPSNWTDVSTLDVKLRVLQWMTPYSAFVTGQANANTNGTLRDDGANFVTSGVRVGDICKNITTNSQWAVTGVTATQLSIPPKTVGNTFSIGDYYSVGHAEDFFLNECLDWMLYKCIQELNFYLKEDQRVQISNAVLDRAWEAVRAWNSEAKTMETDLDLD